MLPILVFLVATVLAGSDFTGKKKAPVDKMKGLLGIAEKKIDSAIKCYDDILAGAGSSGDPSKQCDDQERVAIGAIISLMMEEKRHPDFFLEHDNQIVSTGLPNMLMVNYFFSCIGYDETDKAWSASTEDKASKRMQGRLRDLCAKRNDADFTFVHFSEFLRDYTQEEQVVQNGTDAAIRCFYEYNRREHDPELRLDGDFRTTLSSCNEHRYYAQVSITHLRRRLESVGGTNRESRKWIEISRRLTEEGVADLTLIHQTCGTSSIRSNTFLIMYASQDGPTAVLQEKICRMNRLAAEIKFDLVDSTIIDEYEENMRWYEDYVDKTISCLQDYIGYASDEQEEDNAAFFNCQKKKDVTDRLIAALAKLLNQLHNYGAAKAKLDESGVPNILYITGQDLIINPADERLKKVLDEMNDLEIKSKGILHKQPSVTQYRTKLAELEGGIGSAIDCYNDFIAWHQRDAPAIDEVDRRLQACDKDKEAIHAKLVELANFAKRLDGSDPVGSFRVSIRRLGLVDIITATTDKALTPVTWRYNLWRAQEADAETVLLQEKLRSLDRVNGYALSYKTIQTAIAGYSTLLSELDYTITAVEMCFKKVEEAKDVPEPERGGEAGTLACGEYMNIIAMVDELQACISRFDDVLNQRGRLLSLAKQIGVQAIQHKNLPVVFDDDPVEEQPQDVQSSRNHERYVNLRETKVEVTELVKFLRSSEGKKEMCDSVEVIANTTSNLYAYSLLEFARAGELSQAQVEEKARAEVQVMLGEIKDGSYIYKNYADN